MQVTQEIHAVNSDPAVRARGGGRAGAEVAEGRSPQSAGSSSYGRGPWNPGMQVLPPGCGRTHDPRTYPCDPHSGTMPPDLL